MSLFDTFLMWWILGSFAFAFLLTILCRNRPGAISAIGVFLICASVGLIVALSHEYRIAIFGTDTKGVITDLVRQRRSTYAVVDFQDAQGEEVRFKNRQGVMRATYAVGQKVPVRYLETNPKAAAIANRQSLWQPMFFGTLFSLAPLIVAGFIFRKQLVRMIGL